MRRSWPASFRRQKRVKQVRVDEPQQGLKPVQLTRLQTLMLQASNLESMLQASAREKKSASA